MSVSSSAIALIEFCVDISGLHKCQGPVERCKQVFLRQPMDNKFWVFLFPDQFIFRCFVFLLNFLFNFLHTNLYNS